jgi:hypothetical protein
MAAYGAAMSARAGQIAAAGRARIRLLSGASPAPLTFVNAGDRNLSTLASTNPLEGF